MTSTETTWDGLPIAPDNPRGAGVVVRSWNDRFLLLHRHHNGPAYEGDWAWTSPSGARLPGEPVLACATRELFEETGLSGLDLRPVDLSGVWAVFAASVPPPATVVIDAEHDRYEWVSSDTALARLAPQSVADNFVRGSTLPLPTLSLRPMGYDDLPTLLSWLRQPHVAPWYSGPRTIAEAAGKYGPRIDGAEPVLVNILEVDGVAAGFFQCYGASHDEVGIDYVIGTPEWIGRGLGPQAIWAYLREVVLPAHPAATHVIADPAADNLRSIRALEKAGFVRRGELHALDRRHIFGPSD